MKILSFASLLSKQTTKFIGRHKDDEVFVLSALIDDELFASIKNHHFLKYEIDTLGFVLALVCARLLDNFMGIDEGYLSGESNAGLEEIDALCEFVKTCDGAIISPEMFKGANAKNIAYMLSALSKKYEFALIGINGKPCEIEEVEAMGELEEGGDFNGACVFCLPGKNVELRGSALFSAAAKLKDGSEFCKDIAGVKIKTNFKLDESLKGTCALLFAPDLDYGFVRI